MISFFEWVWLWNAALRQNPKEAPGALPAHSTRPASSTSENLCGKWCRFFFTNTMSFLYKSTAL